MANGTPESGNSRNERFGASRSAVMRRIKRHVENLNHANARTSARAEYCLIRYYGARAVDSVLKVVDHPNPAVRFRAAWILGETGDPRAFDVLLRLADDPDEGVRYDAVLAFGNLRDVRAIPHLIRMLLEDDPSKPAANAIVKIGLAARPTVEGVLKSGNPSERYSAVFILGHFAADYCDEQALELLRIASKDADPLVALEAADWLSMATRHG